ncbi:MAG: N-formylglutamate amidohydrolase [Thermodesulfobacteriota bacterium]
MDKTAGIGPSGEFAYHLDYSLPFIAVALHSGHQVRDELLPYMALDSNQRKFEEDAATDLMIKDLNNAVWALESRSVYDLNRTPDMALPLTPEKFWGTRVYKNQPTPEMNQKSLENYESFYKFVENSISSILDRFGFCIVYEIHSYNISRQQANGIESPPVFNLGTELLDTIKWEKAIYLWLEELGNMSLPGIETRVAENEVFDGKAEFCRRICYMDQRILVLPTEISKVYMDEKKGEVYPDVVLSIKNELKNAILSHVKQVKNLI